MNSGTVALNGGLLDVDQNITVGSNLVHAVGSFIEIENGKALSYTGQVLNIGDLALNISGGGTFENTNNLSIDNAGSILAISQSTKVSRILVSASSSGNGMTISDLSLIHI